MKLAINLPSKLAILGLFFSPFECGKAKLNDAATGDKSLLHTLTGSRV
jgi:hypothetical protein